MSSNDESKRISEASMEIIKLRGQIHRALTDRDNQIKTIKLRYKQELSVLRHKRDNLLSIVKYSQKGDSRVRDYSDVNEPEDSPVRYCKGCGEELLRGTFESLLKLIDMSVRIHICQHTGPFEFKAIRHYIKKIRDNPYCCYWCKQGKSKDGHSLFCSSKKQYDDRFKDLGHESLDELRAKYDTNKV